jgi:hypothetical protein
MDTVNDVEAHESEDALACDLVILTNRIKERLTQRLVHALFERIEQRQRLRVGKGKKLR